MEDATLERNGFTTPGGLYILADLVDQFWNSRDPKLAAKIRLQESRFGLDPTSRRRLPRRHRNAAPVLVWLTALVPFEAPVRARTQTPALLFVCW